MSKSGLADSPFFVAVPTQNISPVPPTAKPVAQKEQAKKVIKPRQQKTDQDNNRDTTTPRYHDTTVSPDHDTTTPLINAVVIESVRKAVKEIGKEAATHRFTEAEKKEIGDLIYTYKNQSVKTSENEITRIAVNFVVEDYKTNGENSVLHKILEALNQ